MKKIFKAGDFVRIVDSTHDDRMPKSRMGHLIEEVTKATHYTHSGTRVSNTWRIIMTNGVELKFHEMFLEHVE